MMLVRTILQMVAGARARRRGDKAGRAPRPTLSDQLRAEEQRQQQRKRDASRRRP